MDSADHRAQSQGHVKTMLAMEEIVKIESETGEKWGGEELNLGGRWRENGWRTINGGRCGGSTGDSRRYEEMSEMDKARRR